MAFSQFLYQVGAGTIAMVCVAVLLGSTFLFAGIFAHNFPKAGSWLQIVAILLANVITVEFGMVFAPAVNWLHQGSAASAWCGRSSAFTACFFVPLMAVRKRWGHDSQKNGLEAQKK